MWSSSYVCKYFKRIWLITVAGFSGLLSGCSLFGFLVNKKNEERILLLGRTRDIIHCARASEPHGTFLPLILFRGGAEQEIMATVTLSISFLSQFLNDTLEGSGVAPVRKDKTFSRTWCLASQVYLTPTISTCDLSALRFSLCILRQETCQKITCQVVCDQQNVPEM